MSLTQVPRIGCAGWNLPRDSTAHFSSTGTYLQRYAGQFSAVEINSSFYRPHRPATYARWAESVPADFRFSVKVPKQITHERRLRDAADILDDFLSAVESLGGHLGCLLVQLPPSLPFDLDVAEPFFTHLRRRYHGAVVCEPRHSSWFSLTSERLLTSHTVGRVAADPAPQPAAERPAADTGVMYYRLHGSPRMYYSAYTTSYLSGLATLLTSQSSPEREIWCIFDNTAAGAAIENALELQALIAETVA